MFERYLVVMLLGHVIADFYTQSEAVAEKKKKEFGVVLRHSVLYLLTISIVTIPVFSLEILIMDVVISVSHAVVDIGKYLYCHKKRKDSPLVFVLDQCFHLASLIIISYIWVKRNIPLHKINIVADFFDITEISPLFLCKWLLGLLIIYKPSNILIQKLIGSYKPKQSSDNIIVNMQAGRKIGTLERFVMLILLYLNQYSAIGLVLTAKSIARYDRITKDAVFAEYYLLGTLISVGISVGCAVVLF